MNKCDTCTRNKDCDIKKFLDSDESIFSTNDCMNWTDKKLNPYTVNIRINKDFIRTKYISADSKTEAIEIILNDLLNQIRFNNLDMSILNINISKGSIY